MARPPVREVVATARKSPENEALPEGLLTQAPADRALLLMWLNNQKPLTRAAYATDIRGFFEKLGMTLAEVSMADVQDYARDLGERGLRPSTQARKIAAVKSLFSMGVKLGLLATHPAMLIRAPTSKATLQERIVSEQAIMHAIDLETDPRNKLILRVLYASGMRRAELCALTWADLKARGKSGVLNIFGKGGKTRSVTIGPNIWRDVAALRNGAGATDAVFRSRQAGHLDPAQLHRIVKRAGKRAGLPPAFSAHWFRHAHASHSMDNGAKAHEVQKTMGHASLLTTTLYVHSKRDSSQFLPD